MIKGAFYTGYEFINVTSIRYCNNSIRAIHTQSGSHLFFRVFLAKFFVVTRSNILAIEDSYTFVFYVFPYNCIDMYSAAYENADNLRTSCIRSLPLVFFPRHPPVASSLIQLAKTVTLRQQRGSLWAQLGHAVHIPVGEGVLQVVHAGA